MKNNFEKYHEAVEYLDSITNLPQPDYMALTKGRHLFLKRFAYFLNLLGNPHKNLKYIHVGGTSGKGSVATMIQLILTEAGYKTGLYLSPHPTTLIERIKVNDLLIGPAEFAELLQQIKPAIDLAYQKSNYGRPSYFEILTAIAFLYFKKQKCDYAVLEVGCGGRYDATNIIPAPKITIINLIDFDHTHLLGKTLIKIAQEKTAIIKPKTKFFTTSQNNKKVLAVFEKTCQKNKVEFNLIKSEKTKYPLNLLGEHQQQNAHLATKVSQKLGITETKIKAGLKKVKLSCRLEIIQKNPMVILDGAHNPSKIKTTINTIKNLALSKVEGLTYKRLYLIIALTDKKDGVKILKSIGPLVDHWLITRYQASERKCYPPLQLAKKIKSNKPKEIFLDPQMALNKALKLANKDDLILVTGSFYLAGELRKKWRPEEKILKERKV